MTTTTPQRPAPTQPASSSWIPTLLAHNLAVFATTALITLAAALSFNGMYQGWDWMWEVTWVVLCVAGAIGVARVIGSLISGALWLDQEPKKANANVWIRAFVPVLAGLAGLSAILIARFFPETAIAWIFPGPETPRAIQETVTFAGEEVMSQVTPVIASPALVALTCFGVGLLVILLDLLAFGVGFPAIAGLIPASLLIVAALVKTNGAGIVALAATAAAYLLLLAVAQSVSSSRVPGGRLPSLLAIVAAGLAAILLVPAAIPGFTSGVLPEGKRLYLFGEPTGVNPVLNLGANLSQPLAIDTIHYYTDSEDPLYLRTAVVSDLAESRWAPSDIEDSRLALDPSGSMLTPLDGVGTADGYPSVSNGVRIRTENYNSPWLPLPNYSETVTGISSAWGWNAATSTIFSGTGAASNALDYTVSINRPGWDAQEMASIAQAERLENFVLAQRYPEETQLSGSTEVSDTYQAVLEDAALSANSTDKFSIAVAIQNYLRSTRFTYSEQTPLEQGYDGNGVNVVDEFLRVKAGYCIHFSSAMALMAREAGIPSRIVVGYAPGRATGSTEGELTEFAVSSRNAHAWPELYFEGLGWVPFEPTPGRGTTPSYAPEATAQAASSSASEEAPSQSASSSAAATESATPSETPEVAISASSGDTNNGELVRTVLTVIGVLALTALLLLIPAIIRQLRRRGALATIRDPESAPAARAIAAWRELTDTARDYGVRQRPQETAAAFANRLAGVLRSSPAPDSEAGAAVTEAPNFQYDDAGSLSRLRSAFEVARYAAADSGVGPRAGADAGVDSGKSSGSDSGSDLAQDLATVTRALQRRADARERFRARFWPASVMNRGS
ncbi:transglutaminase-like putative cysteine protease [Neomicrococcus aestuarii]|uniref:Transglutaminase-like putative cysteine protease n=1 Tax=Neomicrococcus aestuarii TaxID=556325 RepID=A0A7W8WZ33_9MICC|nr:DUF3488 and transglutaminase-like domain-containing protein [Neomicrococcus aestuarii]MBB5511413.1 transglutaminase-like putative cysteine protease [Neomicrococcus aestuarii]